MIVGVLVSAYARTDIIVTAVETQNYLQFHHTVAHAQRTHILGLYIGFSSLSLEQSGVMGVMHIYAYYIEVIMGAWAKYDMVTIGVETHHHLQIHHTTTQR